jgi:hypothetical protein
MTHTTQAQVRAAFWASADPMNGDGITRRRLPDGDYTTDTRCAFAEFVDALARNGEISESLAQRVTL